MRLVLDEHCTMGINTTCTQHSFDLRAGLRHHQIKLYINHTAQQFETVTEATGGMDNGKVLFTGIENNTISVSPAVHFTPAALQILDDIICCNVKSKLLECAEVICKENFRTTRTCGRRRHIVEESIP